MKSFDNLKTEILTRSKDKNTVSAALRKFESHGGKNGYTDRESGVVNTLKILSHVWHVASTQLGKNQVFEYQFGSKVMKGTSQDFVIGSLIENAATMGGCSPGFAGRFVRDLLILLCVQEGITQ